MLSHWQKQVTKQVTLLISALFKCTKGRQTCLQFKQLFTQLRQLCLGCFKILLQSLLSPVQVKRKRKAIREIRSDRKQSVGHCNKQYARNITNENAYSATTLQYVEMWNRSSLNKPLQISWFGCFDTHVHFYQEGCNTKLENIYTFTLSLYSVLKINLKQVFNNKMARC